MPDKRNPAGAGGASEGGVQADNKLNSSDSLKPALRQSPADPDALVAELRAAPGRLVDRAGRPRGESILKNWSPSAIRSLGIRRVESGDAT